MNEWTDCKNFPLIMYSHRPWESVGGLPMNPSWYGPLSPPPGPRGSSSSVHLLSRYVRARTHPNQSQKQCFGQEDWQRRKRFVHCYRWLRTKSESFKYNRARHLPEFKHNAVLFFPILFFMLQNVCKHAIALFHRLNCTVLNSMLQIVLSASH